MEVNTLVYEDDAKSMEKIPLKLEPSRDQFPFCIVWSPIPLLTWLIPFIGHLGIVTSEGIIHDFAGPYFVNKNKHETGFGSVTKFYCVSPSQVKHFGVQTNAIDAWDDAIEKSSEKYCDMMHNLITNSCHSHVAMALNRVEFNGFKHWNTLFLILFISYHGRFVSIPRFIKTYLAFTVIIFFVLIGTLYSKVLA